MIHYIRNCDASKVWQQHNMLLPTVSNSNEDADSQLAALAATGTASTWLGSTSHKMYFNEDCLLLKSIENSNHSVMLEWRLQSSKCTNVLGCRRFTQQYGSTTEQRMQAHTQLRQETDIPQRQVCIPSTAASWCQHRRLVRAITSAIVCMLRRRRIYGTLCALLRRRRGGWRCNV